MGKIIINKKTITKIADLIENKEDFKSTNNERLEKDNGDWIFTYNAIAKQDNKIIILCDYDDTISNEREFLIYDIVKNTLRTSNKKEDDKYRGIDDNKPYMENYNNEFIICKNANNSIIRGDTKKMDVEDFSTEELKEEYNKILRELHNRSLFYNLNNI